MLKRPKPIVHSQGDKISDLDALNSVHDIQGGTIVVHLPPGNVTRQWVNCAILQALEHPYERIAATERKTGVHWTHWPIALELDRVVFYPAENMKPDLIRSLRSAAGPIELWLAVRRPPAEDWPGLEIARGSLEELRTVSRQPKVLGNPVPDANYSQTIWPTDPLKARFIALGFPNDQAGTFSNQFNETFRAAGYISSGKHLGKSAMARMIRVLASNARGEVNAGAYCGIWSRMFRQGQLLENPSISVLRESLPDIRLPNFSQLSLLDESLVFGLTQSGFSLEEVSSLRFDQVESFAPGNASILGIKVRGDLAEVLRCALLRARSHHHDRSLVWSLLVQTEITSRSREDDRILHLRAYYKTAAAFFHEQGEKVHSRPSNLQTRNRLKLVDLVPEIPGSYVESKLTDRDLEILRSAMEQTDWPDRFAREVVGPDDDLERLLQGRYLERVEGRGVEVDQCVAMSQGFPMSKLTSELLERTHYEVRRANLLVTPPDPSRRARDKQLIAAALETVREDMSRTRLMPRIPA